MCLFGRIRSRQAQLMMVIGTTVQSITGIMKFDRVMARVLQMAQPMSIAHRLKAPIHRKEDPLEPSSEPEVVISGMSTKVLSSLAEAPYEKYSYPKMIVNKDFEGEDLQESERPHYRDVQFYEAIMEALLDAGVNPGSLEGTDTGIFIGHNLLGEVGQDAPDSVALEALQLTYVAKRLGMVLKTRGQEQSFCRLDKQTGYLLPLNKAVHAVHAGHCEAAVVACAMRDVSAVFIQRSSSALRPYANLELVRSDNAAMSGAAGAQPDLTGLVKSVRRGADHPLSSDPIVIPAGRNKYLRIKLRKETSGKDFREEGQTAELPLVVPFSSSSEEKVEDYLKNTARNGNSDSTPLLHNIYRSCSLPGHKFRGYTIINKGDDASEEAPTVNTSFVPEEQREVWFVFPGLGSQFPGMGQHLMEIPIFRESIAESASILSTEGVDLLQILDPLNNEINTSIRSAMIAITSVQIGLVNVMTSLGIKPEGYIGYSCGEIMCAYCDGAFDAREALLVSKIYGECIQSVNIARGSMFAIGLSWDEVMAILPPDIYIACNNSPNNVTIGGPTEAVEQFVEELRKKDVKTWPVNSCGFAPHSHSFSRGKGLLLSCLERVITAPISRSPKWVSTSLHDEEVSEFSFFKQNSPMYYFNNLESPVLFHEAAGKIPSNSVVIEIGLSGMLQTVLRDSLAEDCQCLSLGKRKKKDQEEVDSGNEVIRLMTNIGDIFNAGVPVDFSRLYLPDKFPKSSSSCPPLADDFSWDPDNAWKEFGKSKPKESAEQKKGLKLEELM